ncbi:MAG: hypothetical protein GX455_02735 [Phycisphaerae bacterium]|nr:hypothetical protein [Phycisphaerae bacterium]
MYNSGMDQKGKNSLEKEIGAYRRLRCQVDDRIGRLETIHGGHLVCRAGCCDCCVNLTVFAVELYAIASQLAESGTKKMRFDPRASCGWLENGFCRIYAVRPIICRTHGLPVTIPQENGSEGKEVSFCPLNFTRINPETYSFGPDNTLDLADLNERLCRINAKFLEAFQQQGFELPVRLEMARLSELIGYMRA